MYKTEYGTWGTGGSNFTHTRDYLAQETSYKFGTFGNGSASFLQYEVDSLTTTTDVDAAATSQQSRVNTTHANTTGTDQSGTYSVWTSYQSITKLGGVSTYESGNATSTSAVSLTYDLASIKPMGPLTGQNGLGSMALIGEVPLAGNFGSSHPGLPLAEPVSTLSGKALGTTTGWWLELTSDWQAGPGRWSQVKLVQESPGW